MKRRINRTITLLLLCGAAFLFCGAGFAPKENHITMPAAQPGIMSVENLLRTALLPVGNTMYVWGGGWNEADTGAGIEAVSVGISPRWQAFFSEQNKWYDYRNTRYQIHNGLDCSGYMGWLIYNVKNTETGGAGYVDKATKMAKSLAEQGLGSYTPAAQVEDYQPGDVMSSASHVYLVIGTCTDGSMVLAESSPPGVQLSATVTPDGAKESMAARLVWQYMSSYFPAWYERYGFAVRGRDYLTQYNRFRWSEAALSDAADWRKLGADELLRRMFNEPPTQ